MGTCHWTTEPKTVNSLHANKCIHYQTLQGKKKKKKSALILPSMYLTQTPLCFPLLHFPDAALQHSKLNTTFSVKREMTESYWMTAAYSVTTLGVSSKEILLEREA